MFEVALEEKELVEAKDYAQTSSSSRFITQSPTVEVKDNGRNYNQFAFFHLTQK